MVQFPRIQFLVEIGKSGVRVSQQIPTPDRAQISFPVRASEVPLNMRFAAAVGEFVAQLVIAGLPAE